MGNSVPPGAPITESVMEDVKKDFNQVKARLSILLTQSHESQTKIVLLEGRLSETETRLAESQDRIKELEKTRNTSPKDVKNDKAFQTLKQKVVYLEKRQRQLIQKASDKFGRVDKLQHLLNGAILNRTAVHERNNQIENISKELNSVSRAVKVIQVEANHTSSQMYGLNQKSISTQKQLQDLQARAKITSSQVGTRSSYSTPTYKELKDLQVKMDSTSLEVGTLNSKFDSVCVQLRDLQVRMESASSEVGTLGSKFDSVYWELQDLQVKMRSTSSEVETLNCKLTSSCMELIALQAERSCPSSVEGESSVTTEPIPSSYLGGSETEIHIIRKFRDVIQALIQRPGDLEVLMKPVCDMIEEGAETPYLAISLCELLFKQSIEEENFRYTGARICQFLKIHLVKNVHYMADIDELLIKKCCEKFDERFKLLHGSDDDRRNLYGLALFMGELFLNLKVKNRDGIILRKASMPANLLEMMITLLSIPNNENVKCVCQLLKLVGGILEDCVKKREALGDAFRVIFVKLKNLLKYDLSQKIRDLVRSIIKLRKNNWGRSTTPAIKEDGLDDGTSEVEVTCIYYYNGEECTCDELNIRGRWCILSEEEEQTYQEWQRQQSDNLSALCGICMDQEIETAYEDFLLGLDLINTAASNEPLMGDEEETAYEDFDQGLDPM